MTQKQQVEILMNELLRFAKQMLSDHGEFHPFGGYVDLQGRFVHVGLEPGTSEASGEERFSGLVEGLKKRNTNALASGAVANVSLDHAEGDSAVRLQLEHRDGYCVEVFQPYFFSADGLHFGSRFAQKGVRLLF
jgi:hypothetical protein